MRSWILTLFCFVAAPFYVAGIFTDDEHVFASSGAEKTASFTVSNTTATAITDATVIVSGWECNNATATSVFRVNSGDTVTTNGIGPYCTTCALGQTIKAPVQKLFLLASGGTPSVQCSRLVDGGTFASASGGMSSGFADTRYLKLAADNDPLTGALALSTGACPAPSIAFAGHTDTGLYYQDEAGEESIGLCVHGVKAGLIGFAPAVSANGQGNTVVGSQAGVSMDFSGAPTNLNNTLIGGESGNKLTTGQQDTCGGSRSCHEMTTANQVTAWGQGAAYSVLASDNIAVGWHSQLNQTTGVNTSVGSQAMEGHASGAVGDSTANACTALGHLAMQAATTASQDVAVGETAGQALTTATGDVLVGFQAGTALTSGGSNTAVGNTAFKTATTAQQDTCVGTNCLQVTTGNQDTGIGYANGLSLSSGADNTFAGWESGFFGTALTTGSQNTLIGSSTNAGSAARANCSAFGFGAACTADNQVVLGNGSITSLTTTARFTNGLAPVSDNTVDLGDATHNWRALFIQQNVTPASGTLVVAGNVSNIAQSNGLMTTDKVTASGNDASGTAANISSNTTAPGSDTAPLRASLQSGAFTDEAPIASFRVNTGSAGGSAGAEQAAVRATAGGGRFWGVFHTLGALDFNDTTLNLHRGTAPAAFPTCTSSLAGQVRYKEDTDTTGTNSQLCLCARNNGALTYAWFALSASLTGTCT